MITINITIMHCMQDAVQPMLALPADFLGQIYRGPSESGPEAAFHEEDSE